MYHLSSENLKQDCVTCFSHFTGTQQFLFEPVELARKESCELRGYGEQDPRKQGDLNSEIPGLLPCSLSCIACSYRPVFLVKSLILEM